VTAAVAAAVDGDGLSAAGSADSGGGAGVAEVSGEVEELFCFLEALSIRAAALAGSFRFLSISNTAVTILLERGTHEAHRNGGENPTWDTWTLANWFVYKRF
jgi:hypothetical protein